VELGASVVVNFNAPVHITTSNGPGFFASGAICVNMYDDTDVNATNGAAVRLLNISSCSTNWKFGSLVSTNSSDEGIEIDNVGNNNFGATSVNITNPSGDGILVNNVSASVAMNFGDTTVVDNAIGAGSTANGIRLQNDPNASFSFSNVTVVADAGTGLLTSNIGGLTITDNDAGSTSRIEATGRPAISLGNTPIVSSLDVDQVKSVNSTTNGLLYGAGTSGVSPHLGTTQVDHSTGAGVLLQGSGGVRLGTLNITNNTAGNGPGLVATSGALASSAGTISTGTHRAIDISSSGIGATNLILTSVSANNVDHAIVLNNTGALGGLVVTGTGTTAGSGGTISATTDDAILLTNTKGVSLSYMNVQNSQEDGIDGTSVNGLNMTGMSFTNNGNDSGDVGVRLTNLTGSAIWSGLSVTGSALNNVWIQNTSGTLDSLSITGASHFDSLGTSFGSNSILIEMGGNAVMTAGLIDGATFVNNKPAAALVVQAGLNAASTGHIGDAVSNAFVVQNCVFTNNGLHASFQQTGAANLTFKMLNNGTAAVPMTMVSDSSGVGTSTAVNLVTSSIATGTMRGRISGNYIGKASVPYSGSAIGNGIGATIQGGSAILLIDGNVIRQVPQQRGIDVQFIGSVTHGLPIAQSDITITNNDVNPQDSTGFPLSAIYVSADNQASAPTSPTRVRADIRGNTVPSSPAAFDVSDKYIFVDEVFATSEAQLVDNRRGQRQLHRPDLGRAGRRHRRGRQRLRADPGPDPYTAVSLAKGDFS